MPRANAGYHYNFGVDSKVFKDSESKIEAKSNSRHRVCPHFIGSLLLACMEQVQSPLFAHYVTHTHNT